MPRHRVRAHRIVEHLGRGRASPVLGGRARGTRRCRRRPCSGDATTRVDTEPVPVEPGDDLAQHRLVHRRVAHDAALADPGAARFELRLHEQHEVGVVGRSARARCGATVRNEMNERSATQRSAGGSIAPASRSRTLVRSITVDARVVAQRPRELAASDVDRDDVRGAPLQQAVGEAAGRRADVDARARPRTSTANASSAAASLCPPRETYVSPAVVGDDDRLRRASTWRAAVVAGAPPTSTRPASIASTARARLGTRPRRTSSASSRRRTSADSSQPCLACGLRRLRSLGTRAWPSWRRSSSRARFVAASSRRASFRLSRGLRAVGVQPAFEAREVGLRREAERHRAGAAPPSRTICAELVRCAGGSARRARRRAAPPGRGRAAPGRRDRRRWRGPASGAAR